MAQLSPSLNPNYILPKTLHACFLEKCCVFTCLAQCMFRDKTAASAVSYMDGTTHSDLIFSPNRTLQEVYFIATSFLLAAFLSERMCGRFVSGRVSSQGRSGDFFKIILMGFLNYILIYWQLLKLNRRPFSS